jgi:hypothetical protein
MPYLEVLSHLGVNELRMGDWKCGSEIVNVSLRAYGFMANINKNADVSTAYEGLARAYDSRFKMSGQSEQGCPSPVPLAKIPNLIMQTSVGMGFPMPQAPRVALNIVNPSSPVTPVAAPSAAVPTTRQPVPQNTFR